MAKKKALNPVITCEDCIHEYACCAWALGGRLATQNAEKCQFFETVRSSAAYLIGKTEADRWIPVEDGLPDDYDWVLAIGMFVPENIYGKPFISELRKDGKWWGDTNDEFPLEDMGIRITHWMPLPEPPKEV